MDERSQNNVFKNLLLGMLIIVIIVTIPNIIFYSNNEVIEVNPAFAWAMLIVNIILLLACLSVFVYILIQMMSKNTQKQQFNQNTKDISFRKDNTQELKEIPDVPKMDNSQNVSSVPKMDNSQNVSQQNIPSMPIYTLDQEAKDLTRFAVSTY